MDAPNLATAIAEVLPETANPRDELIALGMVTAGVICTTAPGSRAELVERFCDTLRASIATAPDIN